MFLRHSVEHSCVNRTIVEWTWRFDAFSCPFFSDSDFIAHISQSYGSDLCLIWGRDRADKGRGEVNVDLYGASS